MCYNHIWVTRKEFERYVKGEINLDFDYLYECIDKLRSIKDDDYVNMFREYVNLYSSENTFEKLQLILNRKKYLLDNIEKFVNDLKSKRNSNVK